MQQHGIKTSISHLDQPLPAELDTFWACSSSKVALQQFFIEWVCNTYDRSKSVYPGGCHDKGEENDCYLLRDSSKNKVRLLRCIHEEADDRL